MPTTVAALVIALAKRGVLSEQEYREILLQLWQEIPEDDALDDEAMRCRQLIDYLT